MERTLIIPDTHAPNQHIPSFDALLAYAADEKWDRLVQIGDFYDVRAANGHRLENRGLMEGERIADEIAGGKRAWDRLVKATRKRNPKAEIVVCAGNHEDFLRRYAERSPELRGLIPGLPDLFPGADRIIPYSKRKLAYRIGKLHFLHGYTGSNARNAVRKYLNDFGCNLVCGHHHGVAMDSKTSKDGVISAWCLGYLGDPSIGEEYLGGPDNWQHAFAELFTHTDGTFQLYPVVIVKGRFATPGGKVYGRTPGRRAT